MTETERLLSELAKKLRSRAKWSTRDGYYSTREEIALNDAVRDTLEGIAEDIEALLP